MIKYNEASTLGPRNNPTQNVVLPRIWRFFMKLVRVKAMSGIWQSCMRKRYPRIFLNITAMQSSCTSAESRNVANVAAPRLKWKVEIEEK
jgi:hypothetical protein